MSPSVSPFRAPLPAARAACLGLVAVGSLLCGGASLAVAGDPPSGPAVPGASSSAAPDALAPAPAVASPRAASVEAEVRALERVLGGLRRTRTDLRAGRPEAVPADDAARMAHGADLRALREVLRYEGTRAKTLAALAKAVEAKDDAKASAARATLETLDGTFVTSLERIEAGAKASPRATGSPSDPKEPRTSPHAGKPPSPSTADPKATPPAAGGAAQPGEAAPAPRKRTRTPEAAGGSGTGPGKERPAGGASPDGKMGPGDGDDDPLEDGFDEELGDDLGEDFGE